MAGFLDRLGQVFGRGRTAEEAAPPDAVAEESAVVADPAAELVEPSTDAYIAAEPVAETDVAVAEAAEAVAETPVVAEVPAAEAAAPAEAAPEPPAKSAEELEEERLWAEAADAWNKNDFPRVTALLDQLKVLQPESAAVLDEHIASAQYNAASEVEQTGDLQGALFLYEDAIRRNPNLGEASFAIERVQNAIAAANAPAPEAAPEAAPAPEERTYTVEGGDTLSAIAERFYGDANSWPTIFEANRDQLENPDVIQVGQVLRVP